MVRFLINRPIAVTMTLIAIMMLGVVASTMIPVSLMPNMRIPQVTVQVTAANISARELDESVIKPLRRQLMQVPHWEDIRTDTRDGQGTIFMQFEYDADIDFLFIEVNEKIDRAMSSLPREIDRPRAMKASATDIPVFYLNLTLKDDASNGTPLARQRFSELSRFANAVISKRLEQLPQVAMVDISGQTFSEIVIRPDQKRLDALGITSEQFENIITENNLELTNLSISDGQYQYNIRFSSALTTRQEIADIYLKAGGRLYQLHELASVEEQPQRRQGIVRSDGKTAVTMAVIKQADARMSDLKREVALLTDALREDYPHIDFTITRDQTALLDYSIDNLQRDLLAGIILGCLVIFLFMQDFRAPALVTLTIPLSLVISMLGLYLIGVSVNIISLSGLVLGIGMMVDNSIIVIDNIMQRWDRGEPLQDAVVRGTNEVISPLLSSVLTTCAVFLPLIFMSGISGALFYDQAMAVSIGLFSSLLVAITVLPVYYYAIYRKLPKRIENRYLKKLDIDYASIYEKGMKWTFRHQRLVWTIVIGMIVGTGLLFMVIDKEKLPYMTQDDMLLNIAWNQHIHAEENDRRTGALVAELDPLLDQHTAMAGKQQFVLSHTHDNSVSEAVVYLRANTPEDLAKVKSRISQYIRTSYPDAVFSIASSGNIFDKIFSDKEARLVARIRPTDGKSPDPAKLNALLSEIARARPDLVVEPMEWQEVIMLYTYPQLMSLYNISNRQLSRSLENALSENTIFTIREGQYSIPVKLGDEPRLFSELLDRTTVQNRDSVVIPLSVLLRETRSQDLKNIVSGPEGDFYPLNLDVSDREVPGYMKSISAVVARNPDFEVHYSGTYFSNRSMIAELIVILSISLLLLYFILASQFESLVQPLIILSEIAADLFGALLLLWIFGSSLNLMSMIGIIVMCGIVINDSILKVDTINRLRGEGYGLLRAIMTGGQRRLKPIIMTALVTILAIAPFLVTGNMGADLQYPLSLAIIGGMVVGTIVSIFFIPLAYYYIYRKQDKRQRSAIKSYS